MGAYVENGIAAAIPFFVIELPGRFVEEGILIIKGNIHIICISEQCCRTWTRNGFN